MECLFQGINIKKVSEFDLGVDPIYGMLLDVGLESMQADLCLISLVLFRLRIK